MIAFPLTTDDLVEVAEEPLVDADDLTEVYSPERVLRDEEATDEFLPEAVPILPADALGR